MTQNIVKVIKKWKSLNFMPQSREEVDNLCAASDAITAWVNNPWNEGQYIKKAVNEYKELVLAVLRREKAIDECNLVEAYRSAESSCNQLAALLNRKKDRKPPKETSPPRRSQQRDDGGHSGRARPDEMDRAGMGKAYMLLHVHKQTGET